MTAISKRSSVELSPRAISMKRTSAKRRSSIDMPHAWTAKTNRVQPMRSLPSPPSPLKATHHETKISWAADDAENDQTLLINDCLSRLDRIERLALLQASAVLQASTARAAARRKSTNGRHQEGLGRQIGF